MIYLLFLMWPMIGLVLGLITQVMMLRWDEWDFTYVLILPVAAIAGPLMIITLISEMRENR